MHRLFAFPLVLAGLTAGSAAVAGDHTVGLTEQPIDGIHTTWVEEEWDAGVVHVRRVPPYGAVPQGSWQPGGYEGRVGSPYYYSLPGHVPAVVPTAAGKHRPDCDTDHGWSGRSGAYAHGYHRGNDIYTFHFGPGFYRHSEFGHTRFPYYNYRAPWYYPGHPVYNRDTNYAW